MLQDEELVAWWREVTDVGFPGYNWQVLTRRPLTHPVGYDGVAPPHQNASTTLFQASLSSPPKNVYTGCRSRV